MKNAVYFSIILLFSLLNNAWANTEQSNVIKDVRAKSVLDKSNAVYLQNTGIYSKFTQSIEVPDGKTTTKVGEIYLKGNKFKIKFPDQEIYSNDKSVWTYLKDANEVQINDYEADPSDISPSNMFNIYQKDFNYIRIDDEVVLGQKCYTIDLTPIDRYRSYFKIRIWINQKTNLLSRIRIFDKNGYRYNYTINSINHKANLQENLFEFNKNDYPGVKVEDLRF